MRRSVVVIGGGVSGLACALRLVELEPNLEVTLLEKSGQTGGLIRSEQVDDCLIEHGPDSILTEKPAALDLARRVNIESEVISTNQRHRGAYVVCRGRLERIPDGFSMMAPSRFWPVASSPILSLKAKARLLGELLLPRGPGGDESVGHFVRRRFGQEVLTRLAQPLMGGIYGTDVERLSLLSTMPRFLSLEAEHRSVTLGLLQRERAQKEARDGASGDAKGVRYGLFISFRKGVQTLTDAVARRLGERVQLQCAVAGLRRLDDGSFEVALDGRKPLRADAVVAALSARGAASLVQNIDPTLSDRLLDIPYGSTAAVYYCFRRQDITHPLDAFGFVVPKAERRRIIASTWASVKFDGRAPKDKALLRVFFGGDGHEDLLDLSDEKLIKIGQKELVSLIGLRGTPLFTRVSRHAYAMPQYVLGHKDRVLRIEERLSAIGGFELAGNALHGVGIPDAIRSGEAAAERALAGLKIRT